MCHLKAESHIQQGIFLRYSCSYYSSRKQLTQYKNIHGNVTENSAYTKCIYCVCERGLTYESVWMEEAMSARVHR